MIHRVILVLCLAQCIHAQDLTRLLAPVPEPLTPQAAPPAEPARPAMRENAKPAKIFIRQETVEQQLRDLLAARFKPEGELALKFLRPWPEPATTTESWWPEITAYPADGLKSRFVLEFRIQTQDETLGSWKLLVQCQLWREVFISERLLNRGDLLAPDDVSIQKIDTLTMRSSPVLATTPLEDIELMQTVSAARPLLWRDVREIPLVRKGDIVDVVAQEGFLRITTKALATEDGDKGALIAIRNLQSRQEIQAQVTDEQTVHVHF